MYLALCLNILFVYHLLCANDDYFDPHFDESRNCESKELMKRLEQDPIKRCASVAKGSDDVQWEECKQVLSQYLSSSCPTTKIERVRHIPLKTNFYSEMIMYSNQYCGGKPVQYSRV